MNAGSLNGPMTNGPMTNGPMTAGPTTTGPITTAPLTSEPLTSGPITIDILSEYGDLVSLQPEWDALWSSISSPGYQQSSTYTLICWQQMHNDKHSALRCIVIRRSGKVVLIWPLLLRRLALITILSPVWSTGAEYTEPLVTDGPDALDLVSKAWLTARSRIPAAIISMPQVKVGSYLHTVVSKEKPVDVEVGAGYVIQWDSTWTDWDTYCKVVSTGHDSKQTRKRKVKKLAEQGNVEFQILHASSETAAMVDWSFHHKRDWAEKVNKRGTWLYSQKYRNFLVALFSTESAQASQHFAIFLLKIDGVPLASKLVAYNKSKLDWIFTAFDGDWGRYSPGSLLDEYAVRWTFDNSIEIDFGVGPESYKKLWSYNNAIPTVCYRFSGNLLGTIAMQAWEWRRQWRVFRKQIPERAKPDQTAAISPSESEVLSQTE
jgi:CelD/BcsL family acetyltransferase involved in cellulose biosynthesis